MSMNIITNQEYIVVIVLCLFEDDFSTDQGTYHQMGETEK
jgi:hypothetical protein